MLVVRDARIEDIEDMCKVNTQTWLTTYGDILPKEILDKRIQSEHRRIVHTKDDLIKNPQNIKLVGLVDELVIGMCYAGESETDLFKDAGEIYNLYILKEYQGIGLGGMIFNEAMQRLCEQGYTDMVIKCISNNPSCEFYERKGGKLVSIIDSNIYGFMVKENVYYYQDIKRLVKRK